MISLRGTIPHFRSTLKLSAFFSLEDVIVLFQGYRDCNALLFDAITSRGGGGDSYMKQTGMLVVSLRGVNLDFGLA